MFQFFKRKNLLTQQKPKQKNMKIYFFVLLFFKSATATPFLAEKIVVSGPSPHSSLVAQSLFKQGGNIIDISVGTAFALAVTHPYYVSLGAGGFALVKINSKVRALDFRETAPQNMTPDFFEKNAVSSREGGPAVAVPGFVAGMFELHRAYGKLPWAKVLQPALFLAEKGFPVSGQWISLSKKSKNKFNRSGKKLFFKKGQAYKPNEIFKQAQLARALKILQTNKRKAFYDGPIGSDVVSVVQKAQGLLTKEDLKKYQVYWLEPVSISFRGYKVYSMPLPSSGGIILSRALKLIEKQKLFKKKLYSLEEWHLMAEIMDRAFFPRAFMGDPRFAKIQPKKWLSDKNLSQINKTIFKDRTVKLPPPKESEETTHLSLMDFKGNAVSMTLTLNGAYGSHIVSPKYGVVLNNQMDDFTTLPDQANMFGLIQGKNNVAEGGKRPLSSMTPTIVEKSKKTIMVLGGAGGPKIITGVLQTLYRYLINKMSLDQALFAPRLHHQFLPRRLFIENKRLNPELILNLKLKGHKIEFKDYIAQVFVVARKANGYLIGAGDYRKEGFAGGL